MPSNKHEAGARAHPAYLAFMHAWQMPMDLSQGSRMAMEFHEIGVVNAATVFADARAPAEVVEALVAWLRPQFRNGGWNDAGQALRVILKTEQAVQTRELRALVAQKEMDPKGAQAFLRKHATAPVEIRDAMRHQLWADPGLYGLTYDQLNDFVTTGKFEV